MILAINSLMWIVGSTTALVLLFFLCVGIFWRTRLVYGRKKILSTPVKTEPEFLP